MALPDPPVEGRGDPGVPEIVERLAAALARLNGWTRSRTGGDGFGGDTSRMQHLAWCIDAPLTVPTAPREASSRRAVDGGWARTTVRVQWAHKLRAEAHPEDYAEALAAERLLTTALLAAPRPGIQLHVESWGRREAGDRTFLVGTISVVVQHGIDL